MRWEAEVALEKACRIIGVNLDGWRRMNEQTCPPIIRDIGALFVAFSPHIIAHALTDAKRKDSKNWLYPDEIYTNLGYTINGERADWPNRSLKDIFGR